MARWVEPGLWAGREAELKLRAERLDAAHAARSPTGTSQTLSSLLFTASNVGSETQAVERVWSVPLVPPRCFPSLSYRLPQLQQQLQGLRFLWVPPKVQKHEVQQDWRLLVDPGKQKNLMFSLKQAPVSHFLSFPLETFRYSSRTGSSSLRGNQPQTSVHTSTEPW